LEEKVRKGETILRTDRIFFRGLKSGGGSKNVGGRGRGGYKKRNLGTSREEAWRERAPGCRNLR